MKAEDIPLEDVSSADLNDMMLDAYGKVVEFLLRYILLRCSKYTNNKHVAEKITVYTFIATYPLIAQLEMPQSSPFVSVAGLVDDIAPDVLKEESKLSNNGHRAKSEPLLSDEKMIKLATALNRVEEDFHQVLVFRHIEMMSTKDISQIFDNSIDDVYTLLALGGKQLIEHLAPLWDEEVLLPDHVPLWLCDLDDSLGCGLDSAFRERLSNSVMSFLFKWGTDITTGKMKLDYRSFDFTCLN
ncbi:MAG: hypothetical protein DRP65_00230 [Planctomycetota bacterium]|nr:MAG: hypothetical protein DRP65_00230 [Planctomycetota bacterium]